MKNPVSSEPNEADTSPLFARLDLIQQATGAKTLPKTLDELTDVCKKINAPPNLYALGFTLGRTPDCAGNTQNIIWNDGGAMVTKEGKVGLNTPETVAAMKRIKGWWDAKLIPPSSPTWDDTGNNAAFQSKQAALKYLSEQGIDTKQEKINFFIPPGVEDYPIKGSIWLAEDCTVYSVMPHMHLIQ